VHEVFYNAINPQPRHACLRTRLQSLTLGHALYLHEANSPFVSGRPAEWGDLLLAVIICACRTHTEARRVIKRPWFLSLLSRYWGFRCSGMDLKPEFEKFHAYLADEQKRPPLNNPPTGQGRSVGAPWEWLLLEFLTRRMSFSAALDTPMRVAACLWTVRADWDGKVNLATAGTGTENLIHHLWERAKIRAASMANN
jgi:hypothetical protein